MLQKILRSWPVFANSVIFLSHLFVITCLKNKTSLNSYILLFYNGPQWQQALNERPFWLWLHWASLISTGLRGEEGEGHQAPETQHNWLNAFINSLCFCVHHNTGSVCLGLSYAAVWTPPCLLGVLLLQCGKQVHVMTPGRPSARHRRK